MAHLSERGQHTQEYTDYAEGAVAKTYIVYAAQVVNTHTGRVKDDPEGEYVITDLHMDVLGEGTIQFFKENVDTQVATQLTEALPIDDVGSPYEAVCNWRTGPKHDIYFTTTGAGLTKVVVRLQAHHLTYGYANGQEIIP